MLPQMLPILEVPSIRRRAVPITVETYHAMAAQGMVEEKTELLRGVIIAKVSKSPLHEYIANRLFHLALSAAGPGYVVRKEGPLTLLDSEPEPDIAIVAGQEEEFRRAHPRAAMVVMEVAISSIEIDRQKAALYAEAGIPEFWLVIPEEKRIEVASSPTSGVYTCHQTFSLGETLFSLVMPTLRVDLASLFAE
ncbi:MAG: Uma2 family endonuclease [Rhizobiaceae bacterium]|nr:MAG: Uma2 family endonuclease [Rhizobiaceae bacterium]